MRTLKNVLFLMAIAIMVVACQGAATTADQTEEQKAENDGLGQTFGETFEPSDVLAFTDISTKVSKEDSVQITVRGTVDEVCQSKGCWMTIQGGEHDGMMVRFKDYGFFMPKDISGREVVMSGKAYYATTTVDELRHYAEDAGKTKEEIEAITEPKHELGFLADGVILVNE